MEHAKGMKSHTAHLEMADLGADWSDIYEPESKYSAYIPGGYCPSRCITLKGRPMMFAILALAGCSILFFGYDAGIMALVNSNPNYLRYMEASSGSSRDAAAIGGLVSLWFGGFGVGAVMAGFYADKFGRLKTIQIGVIWAILGAALQASAQNFTWMAFARIIGGIGCGHLNTVVPTWTSELADHHLRGAFVAVEFTLAVGGICGVYWMEYGCLKTQSAEFAWRFPLGFQIVFLFIILAIVPFYPESPRHLARTGRIDDARAILERCRLDPQPVLIEQELQEIHRAIRLEATSTSRTYTSMIFKKDALRTRRRVLLGAGVQVMQKFTGIDFITTYAPEMFSLSGYKGEVPNLLAGGNLISYTASVALSIYLIEKIGRRKLMLIGSSVMGVLLIIGGILAQKVETYAVSNPAKAAQLGAGVAAILYVYTFTFGSTWLTVCFVYPTEIFPLASRAKGVALSTVAFSLAGGFVNEITPYFINVARFWVMITFAVINLVMLIPIYLFYIGKTHLSSFPALIIFAGFILLFANIYSTTETVNRHLEDMDLLFAGKSNISWRAEKEFELAKLNATSMGAEDMDASARHMEK